MRAHAQAYKRKLYKLMSHCFKSCCTVCLHGKATRSKSKDNLSPLRELQGQNPVCQACKTCTFTQPAIVLASPWLWDIIMGEILKQLDWACVKSLWNFPPHILSPSNYSQTGLELTLWLKRILLPSPPLFSSRLTGVCYHPSFCCAGD